VFGFILHDIVRPEVIVCYHHSTESQVAVSALTRNPCSIKKLPYSCRHAALFGSACQPSEEKRERDLYLAQTHTHTGTTKDGTSSESK
jgi:hypothetical protein